MVIKTCLQPSGNFGDSAINSYLVEKIAGKKPELVSISQEVDKENYLISGSILASADKRSIVWGAGFLDSEDSLDEIPKKIYAVRGKLTQQKLCKQNIHCQVLGDPALLLPRFYAPKSDVSEKVGIVPHYKDYDFVKKSEWFFDYKIIDICSGIENVIDEIYSCRLIFSSSLHGLIIADAYGIPAFWIKLSNNLMGDGFKFADYFSIRHEVDLAKLWEVCPFKDGGCE